MILGPFLSLCELKSTVDPLPRALSLFSNLPLEREREREREACYYDLLKILLEIFLLPRRKNLPDNLFVGCQIGLLQRVAGVAASFADVAQICASSKRLLK